MDHQVFATIDDDAERFYGDFGYLHLRIVDARFQRNRSRAFQVALDIVTGRRTADAGFRNAEGIARQYAVARNVPAFRDLLTSARLTPIYRWLAKAERLIFTNAKISFKTPYKQSDWFPHQDNGYKKMAHSYLRQGFAVFILLEDMDRSNGAIELYPGSQKLGTLDHVKRVENAVSGEYQAVLTAIPGSVQPLAIEGRAGDVVIFSGDMIHKSGPSLRDSYRLAIIAEVEPFLSPRLDDGGLVPVFASGRLRSDEALRLNLSSVLSPMRYWRYLRRYPAVAKLARRLAATVRSAKS